MLLTIVEFGIHSDVTCTVAVGLTLVAVGFDCSEFELLLLLLCLRSDPIRSTCEKELGTKSGHTIDKFL